ncbi:glycosyltransferase family 25 protein [Mesorhizobium sp. L2C084A000]|uniref:glycosyltransferase family 25 protein n=1 Tax=Mesorhizobium sp. L2C084A000 TaxID=1287116 RepID=UPI0032AFA934
MKRLVINLDRSPDRLARVTAEFARIGVPFERVQAIDARDRPDLDQLPQNVGYRNRLPLTDGEIACLLSHRACWAAIAQGLQPRVFGFARRDNLSACSCALRARSVPWRQGAPIAKPAQGKAGYPVRRRDRETQKDSHSEGQSRGSADRQAHCRFLSTEAENGYSIYLSEPKLNRVLNRLSTPHTQRHENAL